MQLDEFVRETLTQIVTGANQANEKLKPEGALAFPSYSIDDNGRLLYNSGKWIPTIATIKFDVAVTVGEEQGKSGGVGVAIANVGFGAKRTEGSSNTSVSRVSFEIPILLPQHKSTKS